MQQNNAQRALIQNDSQHFSEAVGTQQNNQHFGVGETFRGQEINTSSPKDGAAKGERENLSSSKKVRFAEGMDIGSTFDDRSDGQGLSMDQRYNPAGSGQWQPMSLTELETGGDATKSFDKTLEQTSNISPVKASPLRTSPIKPYDRNKSPSTRSKQSDRQTDSSRPEQQAKMSRESTGR